MLIGSGEEYGHIREGETPVAEDNRVRPGNIYAATKVCQNMIGNIYAEAYDMNLMMVRAYALLVQKGSAGETYNVRSGHAVSIREVLHMIISLSDKPIEVEVDANKLRPVDIPIIEADTRKLKMATGWEQTIPLRQTIEETLEYWRGRV